METNKAPENYSPWRKKLYEIIFGYETFGGKLFDIILLIAILLSVLAVMLESVKEIRETYGTVLKAIEWIFTILFSLEYIARIICTQKTKSYVFSFMGIIDLLSILPTFLSIVFSGAHSLLVLRSIRLIRVFRILKLTRYMGGANQLGRALWESRQKVIVFLCSVLCIVVIMGTLLYIVEDGKNGFTSIPKSIYWAIVTLTTVGYGDIAPQTVLGQSIASLIMIMGYAIIAVPTGIVTSEMVKDNKKRLSCASCGATNLKKDSQFCRHCGTPLD